MSDIISSKDTPRKQCTGPCQRWLPATPDHFHRMGKGSLNSLCKECRSIVRKEQYQIHREEYTQAYQNRTEEQKERQRQTRRMRTQRSKEQRHAAKQRKLMEHEGEKQCPRCEEWYAATPKFFYPQRDKKSGLMSHCRKCQANYRIARKEKMRVWRQANAERLRQQQQHYNQTEHGRKVRRSNAERTRGHRRNLERIRYAKNPQHFRENSRRFRERHPERIKQYWQSHPEQSRLSAHRRRARLHAIPGKHTAAQIQGQLERQKHTCYYCQSKFQRVKEPSGWKYIFHIDHTFPLSRVAGMDIPANSIDYLVLACPRCNLSKHDKFPWEWAEGGRLL